MTGGEVDIRDAAAREPFELPQQERPAGDRHENLGAVGIERAQARALAATEDHGLHVVSFLPTLKSALGRKYSTHSAQP